MPLNQSRVLVVRSLPTDRILLVPENHGRVFAIIVTRMRPGVLGIGTSLRSIFLDGRAPYERCDTDNVVLLAEPSVIGRFESTDVLYYSQHYGDKRPIYHHEFNNVGRGW